MSAGGLRARTGAAEACLAATRALCNTCGRLTDAKLVAVDGRVELVKWCPEHGLTRGLVSSDLDWTLRSLAYVKPGTTPRQRAVALQAACPESCGLCPRHQQHTCVPILELTDACELDCPICLVDGCGAGTLSLEQVGTILDALVACEGQLNMLTLSGGEPTRHPQFEQIVRACRRPEIGILSVSTNGLRLAEDPQLLRFLCEQGVVISLQYDGARPETYARLRGRPELAEIKRRVIEQVLAAGGRLSLTVTLARGVNEDELAGVLELLFGHDQIVSCMVQPLAMTGQVATRLGADPMRALTIPDVVRLLAQQSGGVLTERDFTPLPCSHPTCFALTYLLKTVDEQLVSLPAVVEAETYLDLIKNQALLGTDQDSLLKLKDAVYELWSAPGQVPVAEPVLRTVKAILRELSRLGPGAQHRDLLELGTRKVKSIFIHQFMDRYSFDLSRAVKCCNHYPQPDGRLVPACVRNCCR
jgi:uncharacterized radical SAM superfamily Fe-S cluster-containing enzyme